MRKAADYFRQQGLGNSVRLSLDGGSVPTGESRLTVCDGGQGVMKHFFKEFFFLFHPQNGEIDR